MKIKNVVLGILALTVVTGMFSGCGQEPPVLEQSSVSESSQENSEPIIEETVVSNYLRGWYDSESENARKSIDEILDTEVYKASEEKKFGLTVYKAQNKPDVIISGDKVINVDDLLTDTENIRHEIDNELLYIVSSANDADKLIERYNEATALNKLATEHEEFDKISVKDREAAHKAEFDKLMALDKETKMCIDGLSSKIPFTSSMDLCKLYEAGYLKNMKVVSSSVKDQELVIEISAVLDKYEITFRGNGSNLISAETDIGEFEIPDGVVFVINNENFILNMPYQMYCDVLGYDLSFAGRYVHMVTDDANIFRPENLVHDYLVKPSIEKTPEEAKKDTVPVEQKTAKKTFEELERKINKIVDENGNPKAWDKMTPEEQQIVMDYLDALEEYLSNKDYGGTKNEDGTVTPPIGQPDPWEKGGIQQPGDAEKRWKENGGYNSNGNNGKISDFLKNKGGK